MKEIHHQERMITEALSATLRAVPRLEDLGSLFHVREISESTAVTKDPTYVFVLK